MLDVLAPVGVGEVRQRPLAVVVVCGRPLDVRVGVDETEWVDLAIEAGQLREAMASRAVIEQAKGLVMAMRRCGADAAINELKVVSQRTNIRLQVLATVLTTAVDQRSVLDDQDPVAVKVALANWPGVLRPADVPPPGSDALHAW